MSAASRWLLGPYVAGAWLSSRWWTRGGAPADPVVPGLYLGRMPSTRECAAYAAIVDVSAELQCGAACPRYVSVPQLDLTIATPAQLERTVAAIDGSIDPGPVLVCCALGFSRSALAVAAWLIATGRVADVAAAASAIRRARPAVVLHAAHLAVLEEYARSQRSPARGEAA